MDKNINVDDEIKEVDLADVLGGIPYDVAVDRVIDGVSKDYSNLSSDEFIAKKKQIRSIEKIELNEYVLHVDVTPEDFRREKRF